MSRKYKPSVIEDFIAFEEFLQMRADKAKEKEKKKEPPKGHGLAFAEGMIVAYMAQFVIGPLYKVALVHWGLQ